MKHIHEPPPPIKGISANMQALIDRALAKDPDHRYESAGEMANEFLAIFNGRTISPGTVLIAKLARQAAEASVGRIRSGTSNTGFPWKRIALEVAIIATLAAVAFWLFCPCVGFP